jgi:hypothetical protein
MKLRTILAMALAASAVAAAAAERGPAWESGPFKDSTYFPIAVWLQSPNNARQYKAMGVNLYVGLYRGPTQEQLDQLKAAGMYVIVGQGSRSLAFKDNPTIVGWMHGDEPDNAQEVRDPQTGRKTYGPPIPPEKIVAGYQKMKANDAGRPVLLNLGQGVANDQWKGRGKWGKVEDYPQYVKGCDIVSFDVYPVAGLDRPDGENFLWYVPRGVDRLVKWTEGTKRIWDCIECSRISNPEAKPNAHQIRAEVWMSLIHGSTGLIYFVHQFKPTFDEASVLHDPELMAGVTQINRQIRELAPVLNSPTVDGGVVAKSSDDKVSVDVMVKRHGGAMYVFAVGMRNGPTKAEFEVKELSGDATAEVLGESRTIPLRGGKFEDDFKPYDAHLYRVARAARP